VRLVSNAAHVSHKLALGPARRFGSFLGILQLLGDSLEFGDVYEAFQQVRPAVDDDGRHGLDDGSALTARRQQNAF